MGARYPFSTWANPLEAGHLGLLAELTSVILVPQVAAVLHCGNLPSMSDGKRKGQGRGGKNPPIFSLLSISNVL